MVVGGKEASVTPCFMCHGLDGVGNSAGAFPRLTGQAAFYMYKQLIDYASGARPNDVMTPIARAMTRGADGRRRVLLLGAGRAHARRLRWSIRSCWSAAASSPRTAWTRPASRPAISAMAADGTGDPPLFPYLAGQYAPYTELQLQLWQEGRARATTRST